MTINKSKQLEFFPQKQKKEETISKSSGIKIPKTLITQLTKESVKRLSIKK